jgi:flagellar assembly protein FliH
MEEEVVPRATEPEQEAAMLHAAACADAAAEARRQMEFHTEARVLAERRRVTEVCDRFARDRQRYFATAEEQVVRLALAIAERVLHREAKADPLLLSSAVRAALARVREGSAAVLRVPRAEQELWAGIFPEGSEPIVTIAPDDRMSSGDCVLETIVGRVELGVSVQLEEIGRGFGELAHPYDAPPPPSPEEETVASAPSINLTGNLFDFSVLSMTEGN